MIVSELYNHINEIQKVVGGHESSRDLAIRDSWKRCILEYDLDPTVLKPPYIVTERELREHRERLDRLIRTARYGLESLYRQVADQRYVMLLTDARGITVDYLGDPAEKDALQAAGLYLGAEWAEKRAGTNGVGVCVHTGEALTVHQSDHFNGTYTPLTCTAAPIYDANGKLAAVLDISALQSPEPKESQAMAFHLVESCSRRIEMAELMASFCDSWIIRFSPSPEFLEVDPEGAVALTADGAIAGMTHSAQRLLAAIAGIDWRASGKLIGQRFETFFDFDVNNLPFLARSYPAPERAIGACDGKIFFASAIEPQKRPCKDKSTELLHDPLTKLHNGDGAMMQITRKIIRLASAPIHLLLIGETGTGKEFVARAIHAMRGAGKFIAVNCAAIPETLIESELFGYEAGSFTGAKSKGKRGLIEEADGGTLFLDEIGDMPLALQARLLRVLSENEILRVGALQPLKLSLRVIAATHRDLSAKIKNGEFREDLFYRLNGAVLTLPPLRDREDFDWLANALLNAGAGETGHLLRIAPAARDALRGHSWPGNIRELANVLAFARSFATTDRIEIADLPDSLRARRPANAAPACRGNCCAWKISEDDALITALAEHRWNISLTARALNLDRSTIYRRISKIGLVPPKRRMLT